MLILQSPADLALAISLTSTPITLSLLTLLQPHGLPCQSLHNHTPAQGLYT